MMSRAGKKTEQSFIATVFTGIMSAEVMMLLLNGIAAALIIAENLKEEYGGVAVNVIHFLAMLSGCLIAFTIGGRKQIRNGAIMALGYTCVLILVNLLGFGAKFQSLLTHALTIFGGMLTSLLFSTIAFRRGEGKYRKRKW